MLLKLNMDHIKDYILVSTKKRRPHWYFSRLDPGSLDCGHPTSTLHMFFPLDLA